MKKDTENGTTTVYTFDNSPMTIALHRSSAKAKNGEYPSVLLEIGGLQHPNVKVDTGYFHEKIKDPRLAVATSIIAGVFNEWSQSLRGNNVFTISGIDNSAPDIKSGRITTIFSPTEPTQQEKNFLMAQSMELEQMLENAAPSIQQALDKHASNPVLPTDTIDTAVLHATNLALTRIESASENVNLGLAKARIDASLGSPLDNLFEEPDDPSI